MTDPSDFMEPFNAVPAPWPHPGGARRSSRLGVELKGLKILDLDFALSSAGFELTDPQIKSGGDGTPPPEAVHVGRDQRSRLQASSPGGARLEGSPAARAGDAWRPGPHRLLCEDDSGRAAFVAIDAAIRRWQAATGQDARRHPKGETFASILRARGKRDSETDSCVAVRAAKLSGPRAPAPMWETPHAVEFDRVVVAGPFSTR